MYLYIEGCLVNTKLETDLIRKTFVYLRAISTCDSDLKEVQCSKLLHTS
jgi:hypothetical protein